jgi:hypothetical protein
MSAGKYKYPYKTFLGHVDPASYENNHMRMV